MEFINSALGVCDSLAGLIYGGDNNRVLCSIHNVGFKIDMPPVNVRSDFNIFKIEFADRFKPNSLPNTGGRSVPKSI